MSKKIRKVLAFIILLIVLSVAFAAVTIGLSMLVSSAINTGIMFLLGISVGWAVFELTKEKDDHVNP